MQLSELLRPNRYGSLRREGAASFNIQGSVSGDHHSLLPLILQLGKELEDLLQGRLTGRELADGRVGFVLLQQAQQLSNRFSVLLGHSQLVVVV